MAGECPAPPEPSWWPGPALPEDVAASRSSQGGPPGTLHGVGRYHVIVSTWRRGSLLLVLVLGLLREEQPDQDDEADRDRGDSQPGPKLVHYRVSRGGACSASNRDFSKRLTLPWGSTVTSFAQPFRTIRP